MNLLRLKGGQVVAFDRRYGYGRGTSHRVGERRHLPPASLPRAYMIHLDTHDKEEKGWLTFQLFREMRLRKLESLHGTPVCRRNHS